MTKLTYVSYDYVGGIRDGEWGVFLKVDGEYAKDERGRLEFNDSRDALHWYITNVTGLKIEEDWEDCDDEYNH